MEKSSEEESSIRVQDLTDSSVSKWILRSGIDRIDGAIPPVFPTILEILGDPGGRTKLALQYASTTVNEGRRVLYVSPEQILYRDFVSSFDLDKETFYLLSFAGEITRIEEAIFEIRPDLLVLDSLPSIGGEDLKYVDLRPFLFSVFTFLLRNNSHAIIVNQYRANRRRYGGFTILDWATSSIELELLEVPYYSATVINRKVEPGVIKVRFRHTGEKNATVHT
jgi:KaiC/GvpD/RAD55 family RecA-like ATPase